MSFFCCRSLSLPHDCCISWLNSLTDSYMIRQNSEYDQELPQSQTEDTPNSYTYELYGLSQDTFKNLKLKRPQGLIFKRMCVPGFPTMPNVTDHKFLSTFKGFPSLVILFPFFPM